MEEYLIKFIAWAKLKIRLHLRSEDSVAYFKEREIWWASLGVNIGYEQDGKNEHFERPILIVRKFNRYILWALPMSSKIKDGPFYSQVQHEGKIYSILLSQLRLVSSKRLLRKIRMLPSSDFREVKRKLRSLI